MEFWNDIVTDRSWNTLIKLAKELDFILIGGWATYLHTKTLKSKDIDIVVNFNTLEKLGMKYRLKKNTNLKKYEIIIDEVSVDIYVPFFSKLVIPLNDLEKMCAHVQGMKVLSPEILLVFKQQAELERKDSVKGQKDRVDILSLLINTDFDFAKYFEVLKKYDLLGYSERLRKIVIESKKEFEYLGIRNPRKIKLLKKELLKKLKIYQVARK